MAACGQRTWVKLFILPVFGSMDVLREKTGGRGVWSEHYPLLP